MEEWKSDFSSSHLEFSGARDYYIKCVSFLTLFAYIGKSTSVCIFQSIHIIHDDILYISSVEIGVRCVTDDMFGLKRV